MEQLMDDKNFNIRREGEAKKKYGDYNDSEEGGSGMKNRVQRENKWNGEYKRSDKKEYKCCK